MLHVSPEVGFRHPIFAHSLSMLTPSPGTSSSRGVNMVLVVWAGQTSPLSFSGRHVIPGWQIVTFPMMAIMTGYMTQRGHVTQAVQQKPALTVLMIPGSGERHSLFWL